MAKNSERRAIDKVFIALGVMAAVVLLGASALGFWGYNFATSEVHTELPAQKIYFPAKDHPVPR